MALNKTRLKNKIKAAFDVESGVENNPEASRDRIADALATAICEEILQMRIVYSAGLTASTYPVTGTFNYTLS